ncbi:MAG: alpha/beta hydrolase [Lachnospiraceae bacterium]|nr:alpha/beta hydrolase [Lachnospiraceae bacterium]
MREFRENIWNEGEYDYSAAYGFIPNIHGYIHDEEGNAERSRDCVIVLPGGGYCVCAPHEGEPVALEFYNRGMNAFVLTYTTDITMSVPLKRQPMEDVSRAVRFVRKKADEYKIAGGRVIILGFSAAGHVCGSLAVHYKDVKDIDPEYEKVSNKPDGVVLSYPVISTGEYGHVSSFDALLGREPSDEELEYFSLEKQVTSDVPPCFLWQTMTDELVPVENSYLFAGELKKNGVPFAHYVFPAGLHGLGTVKDSIRLGGDYTMEQVELAIAAVKRGEGVNVSDKRCRELKEEFPDDKIGWDSNNPHDLTDVGRDAGLWTELAYIWISRL